MPSYLAATLKKGSIVIIVCALIVAGIVLSVGRRPTPALWIRISGVAPFLGPKQPGGWRVEVPKLQGKSDAVIYWSVSIQETNAFVAKAANLIAHLDSNDLYNWSISQTESGIVTGTGSKLDSNKVYRAIGVFQHPYGQWVTRIYKSPFRPLLRLVPEPARYFATSQWVRVQFPQRTGGSQLALTNQPSELRSPPTTE